MVVCAPTAQAKRSTVEAKAEVCMVVDCQAILELDDVGGSGQDVFVL